jgi:hypothetical protein
MISTDFFPRKANAIDTIVEWASKLEKQAKFRAAWRKFSKLPAVYGWFTGHSKSYSQVLSFRKFHEVDGMEYHLSES